MNLISADAIKYMRSGYMTNAFVAPVSSFATLGVADAGTNIINVLHIQHDKDIITSVIVTPVLPRQFENNSESLGEPGSIEEVYKVKIFFPGDGPEYMAMLDSLISEPLIVMMEDPALDGYYVQLGSAKRPVFFIKQSFVSGTQMDGKKGFEIEAVATCRYFYNYDISIKKIFEGYAASGTLPIEPDISDLAYNSLPEIIHIKADLLLVPVAYSTGVVYAVDKMIHPIAVPFSRSTSGTRINADGYIELMPPNMPRMNYDLAENNCSYLVEAASTNRVWYSLSFTGTTIASGATTSAIPSVYAPATVKKLAAGGTLRYDFGNMTPGYFSASFFVKSDEANTVTFQFSGSVTGMDGLTKNPGLFIVFNFATSTATVGYANGTTDLTWIRNIYFRQEHCANGWIRIMATFEVHNVLAIALLSMRLHSVSSGFIYATCPQFEEGLGSSFIPTNGSAATRTADNISYEAVSAYQGTNKGAVLMHLPAALGESANNSPDFAFLKGADLTDDYQIIAPRFGSYEHQYKFGLTTGSHVISTGYAVKMANQYNEGQFKHFSDGNTELDIYYTGATGISRFVLNPATSVSRLRTLAFFNATLLNSELISITS